MPRANRATNAQKMILLALDDGWSLRRDEKRGWQLYQPGWQRPFANVSSRNVREMTVAGWLNVGERPAGLGTHPTKHITPLGRAYAIELNDVGWGRTERWKRENGVRPAAEASDYQAAA